MSPVDLSAVLVEDGPDKGAIWHFGEPVKEQRALENGSAWADLSHLEIVAIKGEDRLTWLHALTTQHHEQLQPGVWQEALILDPQGHLEYQFLLVDDGDTVFLVLDPGYKQTLIELYKENEHGEELVKDIEKVLKHADPTPRAKEYLKRCLTLVKEK